MYHLPPTHPSKNKKIKNKSWLVNVNYIKYSKLSHSYLCLILSTPSPPPPPQLLPAPHPHVHTHTHLKYACNGACAPINTCVCTQVYPSVLCSRCHIVRNWKSVTLCVILCVCVTVYTSLHVAVWAATYVTETNSKNQTNEKLQQSLSLSPSVLYIAILSFSAEWAAAEFRHLGQAGSGRCSGTSVWADQEIPWAQTRLQRVHVP